LWIVMQKFLDETPQEKRHFTLNRRNNL